MPKSRATHVDEYLRHTYTDTELAQMGREIGEAYGQTERIEEEEKAVKTQFAARKATHEARIGELSGKLGSGFEMKSVRCRIEYDKPNVGEVTIVREDNGAIVRTRPMTEQERQMELDLAKAHEPQRAAPEVSDAVAEATAEASASNVVEFFKEPAKEPLPPPIPVVAGEFGDGKNWQSAADAATEAMAAEQAEPEDEEGVEVGGLYRPATGDGEQEEGEPEPPAEEPAPAPRPRSRGK